jgi:transcriptional regulator with XRE-family HTH domain
MSVAPQKIILGEVIKARVESMGISKAEIARRMKMSPANVHKIFKRTSLDIEMLRQFSAVLRYDFISHYHYLTANALSAAGLPASPDHDSAAFYIRSLHRKIVQVLTASRQAIVSEPPESAGHLVADIDFIRDILTDMLTNHQPKNPTP